MAIGNTAAGGGYGESAAVTATVADSDTKQVLLSTTRVALTEGGSTGSYTVRLTAAPTTTVTVTVDSGDAGAVSAAPDTLNFTTATWSTSQTVVLTPEEDADGHDESVVISHAAADGGYGAVTVADVTAAVADDDRAVLVFPDSLALTEGGSSASYTVTLATTPTAAVTVTVSSGDADAVSAAPTTLDFTTTTWSTSQTVVLTPVADLDGEDETVAIGNTAAGGGYGESAAVTATVADSDTKQVLLSTTRVALTEGGSTGSYTVRLTAAPTTTVTVTVDSGDAGAVTAAPDTLTFTTSTWSTSQTVVLTPEEDADGHDESVAISHAAADGGYGAVTVADVTATVADDDRAVRVFPDSLALTEGGSSASYTVTLGDHADGGGDRDGEQRRRRRGERSAGHPELHHDHVEHVADRSPDAGGGPGRGRRDGGDRQHGRRRRLRGVGGGDRDGGRQRHEAGPAVDDAGGADRGRVDGQLHGAPVHRADR